MNTTVALAPSQRRTSRHCGVAPWGRRMLSSLCSVALTAGPRRGGGHVVLLVAMLACAPGCMQSIMTKQARVVVKEAVGDYAEKGKAGRLEAAAALDTTEFQDEAWKQTVAPWCKGRWVDGCRLAADELRKERGLLGIVGDVLWAVVDPFNLIRGAIA